MAISTYSELSVAVQKYVVYDDISSEIDTLLDLAEAVLNREVRIRELKATQSYASQTTQTAALPSDFAEAIVLYEDSEAGGVLEYVPPKMFYTSAEARNGTNGQPAFYTMDGDNIVLDRTPDSARDYALEYYATITGLSATNTTNALLTKAPDVYLWQVLYQAALLVGNATDEARFEKNYLAAKASLQVADKRAQLRPGPRMRSRNTRDGAYRLA